MLLVVLWHLKNVNIHHLEEELIQPTVIEYFNNYKSSSLLNLLSSLCF